VRHRAMHATFGSWLVSKQSASGAHSSPTSILAAAQSSPWLSGQRVACAGRLSSQKSPLQVDFKILSLRCVHRRPWGV
jgi:hypothetical protein